ncbi:hypothetical protein [Campylobacter troglodytis]|uniref:hypothetical protein n=1 Tax=Campylobacter troglodytis TaxID=654363 RepID=UPI00115AC4F3|nr:hypothetical protein [Campylobacter troglodytis]TQR53628.1 hypothetical protein DMC01_10975 [Campylobacter troglodytis]
MTEELLYLIFVFILLLASLAYFFIKDKENLSKIHKLEQAIEEINKNIHYIRKELEEKEEEVAQEPDLEKIKEEVRFSLDREINSKILPILKSLQGFEKVVEDFQNEQENRLSNLEQKAQNMSKLSPDFINEEQRIIDLFHQGRTVEQIAKDLRISTGNVEFTLKMKELL